MKLSFINPRKKSVVSPELKLLFIFFGITMFMLFITYLFLLVKDYMFTQDKAYTIEQISELSQSQETMENRIELIKEKKSLGEKINTQNIVLKDSITNLFDLIPSRITLSQARLLKNGLILYGITPNEDVYNFMLQAPLRSIFNVTYSSFYPIENGWLRFVSTNYINEDDVKVNKKEIKKDDEEEVEDEH